MGATVSGERKPEFWYVGVQSAPTYQNSEPFPTMTEEPVTGNS